MGFLGSGRGKGRRECSEEVVQGLAAVPDCRGGVAKFADCAKGDLLVYCAGVIGMLVTSKEEGLI